MELEIQQISTADRDFDAQLSALLSRGMEFDPEIDRAVAQIIAQVRTRGDRAVLELTRQYDRSPATSFSELVYNSDTLEKVASRIDGDLHLALQTAADRIRRYHERQLESSWVYDDQTGNRFGQKLTALDRVGVYVPGGKAAYPSSVLMTAVTAKAAGVREVVMTAPAPDGEIRDSVLAAAHIAGVDRVFTIGGAQAVAALAFGTESVPKVDKIVGPGNAWVSAAKRQVFGFVGIDLIAGPSEVVVVCDDTTNAEWAAMDLFAQAEHDEDAQSIAISLSREKLDEVREHMRRMLPQMERSEVIAQSLADHGALVHVRDSDQLVDIIDRIAPEHLELMTRDAEQIADNVRNAGAIFIGAHSAEVLGDYCAGPNHVLPTSGSARFSSPLGVYDFMKKTSIINCSPEGARDIAQIASLLAREEQLTAHARSADFRWKDSE